MVKAQKKYLLKLDYNWIKSKLTDKSTLRDTSTLIGYLQSKSIIGNKIGEDTGKYQVNVTALLGSKQSLWNGDVIEELKDVWSNKGINF